jgi:hypothetical protein
MAPARGKCLYVPCASEARDATGVTDPEPFHQYLTTRYADILRCGQGGAPLPPGASGCALRPCCQVLSRFMEERKQQEGIIWLRSVCTWVRASTHLFDEGLHGAQIAGDGIYRPGAPALRFDEPSQYSVQCDALTPAHS